MIRYISNGPLRVLAGTHRAGVLTEDQIHELKEGVQATDCLVARGGVFAMRPLLGHTSSKSQNEERRSVLHIEYAESTKTAESIELAIV